MVLTPGVASRIFPVVSQRCLLIDDPHHRVLSMHYNDIIYWSDSLSKLVATDIFYQIANVEDYESKYDIEGISFWMDDERRMSENT